MLGVGGVSGQPWAALCGGSEAPNKLIWLLVIEMFERKWGEGGENDGLYKNERCMGKCWV